MGIEIYHKDIETSVDWSTAIRRAARLNYNGEGWRLPSIKELEFMNTLYLSGIGNFHSRGYWSCDGVEDNYEEAWAFDMGTSPWKWKDPIRKTNTVRPVRDIKSNI